MEPSIEISIVIPTLNRKESLKQTLTSLCKQTYSNSKYEIIICDDITSHDETEQFVKNFAASTKLNINYFKIKANYPGPAAARNYGVNNASGNIIAFIDDDCIAFPDWIASAMELFKNNKIDIIQGSVLPKYPDFKWSNLFRIPRGVIHMQDNGFYVTANLFVKKSSFVEVNGFEEKIKWGEDTDLVYRLLKNKNNRIIFSENTKVYHEMDYLNILQYLNYLQNYSYLPLQIKRNPEMRKHLFLRVFSNKYHIYPLVFFLALISYIAGFDLLFKITLALSVICYISSRVVVDTKLPKYILRILVFPRNMIIDSVRLYYTIKGSLKHKCLVL
jgi:glycosyltransferase involved in cell wall biosynthesis